MKICEYGCEQEAKHQFKNGKWCCSKYISQCPEITMFRSQSLKNKWKKEEHPNKGNSPPNKGKKGLQVAWNKGLTKKTDKRVKIYSKKLIGKKATKKQRYKQSKTKRKLYRDKRNHPSYKGEYFSKNIPLYDTYANQLTIEENPQRDIIDKNILTVICTHCKKRFIPKTTAVGERVRCLNGKNYGECRLYCSDDCKINCSIFNKHYYQKGHQKETKKILYTHEDYQTFRQYVLERDRYECQYCGKKAEHVHHERPQKLEPFFALDPDFAWSCCKECHYEKGHKNGTECSTGNLAKKLCQENI